MRSRRTCVSEELKIKKGRKRRPFIDPLAKEIMGVVLDFSREGKECVKINLFSTQKEN